MPQDVLLFAGARQAVDRDRVTITLPVNGAIQAHQILDALHDQYPQLRSLLPSCRLAVNSEYVSLDTVIAEDSEVALIPPVSGG